MAVHFELFQTDSARWSLISKLLYRILGYTMVLFWTLLICTCADPLIESWTCLSLTSQQVFLFFSLSIPSIWLWLSCKFIWCWTVLLKVPINMKGSVSGTQVLPNLYTWGYLRKVMESSWYYTLVQNHYALIETFVLGADVVGSDCWTDFQIKIGTRFPQKYHENGQTRFVWVTLRIIWPLLEM